MSAEVVTLHNELIGSGRRVEPNRVLAGARSAGLKEVFVCGFDADGDIYIAGSEGPGDTLWLIEIAKRHLLAGGQE